MSTKAINMLKKKKVAHRVITYEHEKKGAEFASRATGFPLERTVKTLVVDLCGKGHALALMPGDRETDLKMVAAVFSAKKAVMADTATAQRLTGYLVGGISPFGVKKRLPSVMEESLLGWEEVAINAGQRGKLLVMDPNDIQKTLGAVVSANISKKG